MSEENVIDENLEVEELSTEDKKKAINLQDLIYVKEYIKNRHYSKAETDEIIDDMTSDMDVRINSAVQASTKSYTKEESDERYLKKSDEASLTAKADRVLDINSNSYKQISIVTADEYTNNPVSSEVIYLVKE